MSLNFSFDFGSAQQPERPDPGRAFRILMLADFSARTNRDQPANPTSRPVRTADLDTIEELPAEFGTTVRTAAGLDIPLAELDHLHPDELYRNVPVFAALRDLRKRLNDTSTFAGAAKEVAAMTDGPLAEDETAQAKADDFASLLDSGFGSAGAPASPAIDALVRSAMAPHIVAAADPRKDELVAAVDLAISAQMRTILRDPAFAKTESAWLGLRRLITQLELDDDLTLHAADVSLADLAADARDGGRGIDALLDGPARGEEPITLAVVHGMFDGSEASVRTLTALAAVGRRTGTAVVAGAHPRLLGTDSIADTPDARDWHAGALGDAAANWDALRAHQSAGSLALVAPRFLSRLPYGARTDEVDAFDFEERADDPAHGDHPWSPAGVLVAEAFGRAFRAQGWSMPTSGAARIDDLPVVALPDGSMLPCAEAWVTESSAEAMLGRGVTPLLSVRGAGEAVLGPISAINREPLRWH
ncbi:MAG: type VI secretion system contractile sheath large subunit [Planctomycetota bacterium]